MIAKERVTENVELLRPFLIHHHDDEDDNSLYVRFSEVMSNYGDLTWRLDLYEETAKAIKEFKNDSSIGN